jgi:hypothetical protein
MSKKAKEIEKIEREIFESVGIDPNAPYDSHELDSALRQRANANALNDILSKTTEIHEKATGKGGRRSKISKKSKKRKSTLKKRKSTLKKRKSKRRAKRK